MPMIDGRVLAGLVRRRPRRRHPRGRSSGRQGKAAAFLPLHPCGSVGGAMVFAPRCLVEHLVQIGLSQVRPPRSHRKAAAIGRLMDNGPDGSG